MLYRCFSVNDEPPLNFDFVLPKSMRVFFKVNARVVRIDKSKEDDSSLIGVYFDAERDVSFMDVLKPFIRQKK